MITWHWQDEEHIGVRAHARKMLADQSLCGSPSVDHALFRPPYPIVRCEKCETLRGDEVQAFPNFSPTAEPQ